MVQTLTQGQLGVCSWSLQPRDAADLADMVAQLGLKKVQLALNPVCDAPEAWGDVQRRLEDIGVSIVSGVFETIGEDYSTPQSIRKTGGVVPDEHWPGNRQMLQDVAAVAETMGLQLISSHLGFLPEDDSDPDFAPLVDRIAWIGKCFGESGVTLLFETGQENAQTLERFLDAVIAAGAANVGVNFDPANMILYDMGDPVASLEALLPRVRQVHIKDATRTTTPGDWGAEVVVGTGEVDWPSFINTLAKSEYRGNMLIEREAGDDRLGDIAAAVKRIGEVINGLC